MLPGNERADPKKSYMIRLAAAQELPLLQEIELTADSLFQEPGIHVTLPDDPEPLQLDTLRSQQAQGLVWVVADITGQPVGFAVVLIVDGRAHLEQIAVLPQHGRRGLGTRLVLTVCEWAKTHGYPAVTLSTFRDVPWNAPFYARLGFRILREDELGPGLLALREHETQDGLAADERVFMIRLSE